MITQKLLIGAATRAGFEEKLAKKEISQYQVAFIQDTKEIWAQGIYYPCPYTKEEIQDFINSLIQEDEKIYDTIEEKSNQLIKLVTQEALRATTKERSLEQLINKNHTDLQESKADKSSTYTKDEVLEQIVKLREQEIVVSDEEPETETEIWIDTSTSETQNISDLATKAELAEYQYQLERRNIIGIPIEGTTLGEDRTILDPKDIVNGEKVYLRNHAKATYLSWGKSVEDALNDGDFQDKGKDLSRQDIFGNIIPQSTANCYVVKEPGLYRFPIVYGNAIKNAKENKEAYTKVQGEHSMNFVNHKGNMLISPWIDENDGCESKYAQLSISDEDNIFSNIEVIDYKGKKYIQFRVLTVPTTGANGIISVLDATNTIMWSWHIWVWEDDLTPVELTNHYGVEYNILPYNLGSKWDDSSKTYIKNWFWQWGRPNPMLCPANYNSNSDHPSYGKHAFKIREQAQTFEESIMNPTTFYVGEDNWFKGNYYNLWDAQCTSTGAKDVETVKTIYDPCPVGYKVPNGNVFTGFTTTGQSSTDVNTFNIVGSYNNGYNFKRNVLDQKGHFFSSTNLRNKLTGTKENGNGGCHWSSASSYDKRVYFSFYLQGVLPLNSNSGTFGFSIRPISDTGLEGQSKITTIRIDQTMLDPEGIITRTEDLGGIEAIRNNSHRYTGTINNEIMELKQLDDFNADVYLDGEQAENVDVWLKLPQFYYRVKEIKEDVYDFSVAYGAKPSGDDWKFWDDKQLIGVYKGSIENNKLYSKSKAIPTINVSYNDFKASAGARGMSLINWEQHCMLTLLFYMQYSNTNSQEICGSGTTAETTGTTDYLGMQDTLAGSNGEQHAINFLGLEGWWGNGGEYLDNIIVNNEGNIELIHNNEVFTFPSSSSGFISKVTINDFPSILPKEVLGSETTGYCDKCELSNNSVVARSGTQENHSGILFMQAMTSLDKGDPDIGSRVTYYGEYVIK